MQIDRASLEKLLSMNDRQLMAVISALAQKGGIDPSTLNIDVKNVQSKRQALGSATDADLARIAAQYEANRKMKG